MSLAGQPPAEIPADGSAPPEPDLLRIWSMARAYQETAALRAAVDLELFAAIGEGAATVEAMAERCQASQRGIRILCDFLVVAGLLTKHESQYGNTPESATFLDRRSPAYVGGVLRFINSREVMSAFDNLTEVVRRGTTLMGGAGMLDVEDPVWVEFARSMVPIARPAAAFIAALACTGGAPPRMKVLDVAAGHGMFGIAIAGRHSGAEIVAVDWPDVLQVAHENATAAGVHDRYHLLAGNAFEVDPGSAYDLALITNFLHHFDRPTCESFARKVHACLKPEGRVITLDFVPNEDRVSPPVPATFALMMLSGTPAGDAYTFAELDRMFRRAGFARSELLQVPRSPQQVILTWKTE